MFLAAVWLLIHRNHPPEAHQIARSISPAFLIVALHVPGHLARPKPRHAVSLRPDRYRFQRQGSRSLTLVILSSGIRDRVGITTASVHRSIAPVRHFTFEQANALDSIR